MTSHQIHLHAVSPVAGRIPAGQVLPWRTPDRVRADNANEGHATPLAETAAGGSPADQATFLDTLRRLIVDRQSATIDGVLIDPWSAAVTIAICDHLNEHNRHRLLRLPSHALIQQCLRVHARLTAARGYP